jgi:hypothetical protein
MMKMLFQHPWDKSVATTVDGEDILAVLSPVTEEAPNDRSRFEILSSKLQRLFKKKCYENGQRLMSLLCNDDNVIEIA